MAVDLQVEQVRAAVQAMLAPSPGAAGSVVAKQASDWLHGYRSDNRCRRRRIRGPAADAEGFVLGNQSESHLAIMQPLLHAAPQLYPRRSSPCVAVRQSSF